jgi:hypothetical protein
MLGRITDCVLLVYRTSTAAVKHLLPDGIEPLTHGGWAFWNIVACRVAAMRPRHCPRWLGSDYVHVAYRLYARARTPAETIDGLYFVRSDANQRLVCHLGNWATDFHFHKSAIELIAGTKAVSLRVRDEKDHIADAELEAEPGPPELGPDSCFSSYALARQILKYRPIALSPDLGGRRIKLAHVLRDETAWRESPLAVTHAHWAFLDQFGKNNHHFELATRVAPLDYRWQLGQCVKSRT